MDVIVGGDFATINYAAQTYANVYRPQSRNPFSQRRIRWFSLDMLRHEAQKEMPVLVNVTSTKQTSDVVYNCNLSTVASRNTWTVSYTYSEFVDFKTKLDVEWTCQDANCSGSCQGLRDIVSALFPKKGLSFMQSRSSTINSRETKFELVLVHFLRSVLLPGSALRCLHARQNIPDNLFEFIGVKDAADRRSVLQILIDDYQVVNPTNGQDTTQCTICLQPGHEQQQPGLDSKTGNDPHSVAETSDPQTLIKLPCNHAFHRKCIFQWLLFEFHCPMCRESVCPGAFTNNCRPGSHLQWWVSDFEEGLQNASDT